MEDVIPIFDFKRTNGVVVDVFLTNSTYTVEEMKRDGHSMTIRFVFSKSKDNIFMVDGEEIKHQINLEAFSGIKEVVMSELSKATPNDSALKKVTKEKSKEKLCAE